MPPANCTAYISSDASRYTDPLPWIGLYVAAASSVCAAFMAFDLYRSVRHRKLWIAPKLFSLNAATLTVLSIATKLPSDITTSMPGVFDQLSKLTGTVLICIAMNHVMPSLGLMSGVEVLSNVVALGILVVTVFVNVWIQIHTGVITGSDNGFFSIAMLLMYVVFLSYSLTVTATRKMVENQYGSVHESIVRSVPSRLSVEDLKDLINKYWLMALTSSPDYTMLSSGMCAVSGILCYGVVSLNFVIPVLSTLVYAPRKGGRHCYASSDYRWSTVVIFATQSITILVGTIASVMRGANSRPPSSFSRWMSLFRIEKHWVYLLLQWRESPLRLKNRGRRTKKAILATKNLVVDLFLVLQISVILASKLYLLMARWVWNLVVSSVRLLLRICGVRPPCLSVHDMAEEQEGTSHAGLMDYVLQLEGEEKALHASEVARRWRKYPQKWIESGRRNQPTALLDFLRQYTSASGDYNELGRLYNRELSSGSSDDLPPKCWSLPLATLASIILATSAPEQRNSGKWLVGVISQGLKYSDLVEKNLGDAQAAKMRDAADMVWEGIDLFGRWLDVDLDDDVLLEASSWEWTGAVAKLRDAAREQVEEGKKGSALRLPSRLHAAECMHKVASAVLSGVERGVYSASLALPEQMEGTVGYALAECLANLPMAILVQCSRGAFGEREERVREAAVVLGEVEGILLHFGAAV